MNFVLAKKSEMTQVFLEDGRVVPVTILLTESAVIAGLKKTDIDGYEAVVVGFGKKKNPNKADTGKYKVLNYVPASLYEFRVDSTEGYEIGKSIDINSFQVGTKVDVIGITKGKGFQGVVKRYNFAGGPKTHGQSDRHRAPGSIGPGTTPGRVYKGKKMPGRMGQDQLTVKNLEIISIDSENNMLLVKGAVPGKRGDIIRVKQK